jgi:thioredoxin 1
MLSRLYFGSALICFSIVSLLQGTVTPIYSEEQFSNLLNRSELIVVKFFATWCPPCKKLKPDFEKASKLYTDLATFAEVDVEICASIAEKYNVVSFPRILIFRKGKLIGTFFGYKKAEEIKAAILSLPPE